MEIQSPNHVVSLASSGVLVNIDIKVWSATKQDKGISEEVAGAYKASKDSGRYTKNLLANHPKHRALANHRQTMRNWLQRRAYPWHDQLNYVPTVLLDKFMKEYREYEVEHAKLRDEFIEAYPNIISDMAFKNGDMFNRSDYPDAQDLMSKFTMNLYVSEVPTNDYRNAISQDIAEDLKKHYNKQAEKFVDAIMQKTGEQLVTFATRISNACRDVTDEEGRKRNPKIYSGTLEQAKELCDTLSSFNLTKNPVIEQARSKLAESLRGVDAQTLRDSSVMRSEVKESADEVLDVLKKFDMNPDMFD